MTTHWNTYRSSTYDELIDANGMPREAAASLIRYLESLGDAEIEQRRQAANLAIQQMGITFTVYSDGTNIDRDWPFDIVPRIIALSEWQRIEQGLAQRLRALNRFIHDLYNDQQVVADGVFPAELLANGRNFLPQCRNVSPPHEVWAHICGSDLVRDRDGTVYVLEDNLRVPSGVSYMLENREIMKRTLPEMFVRSAIMPVDAYTDQLQSTLASLHESDNPTLCVLTPGVYNSAYFEHVFLAQQIGAILVEGRDLVVQDDIVYVRNVEGLQKVDVIYRRIDDAFLDPECFRKDSALGARGLMRAWKAGNVAIANAPGSGIADDKVVYSYVPDIIRYYLNEEPLLPNVPTYRCSIDEERDYVLAHLPELVVKPANESGGYGMLVGPHSTEEQQRETADRIREDPRNYIAQPTLAISTAPTLTDKGPAPRHVDLRPFILQGESLHVTTGGLTRVALREGSLVVNSSQGGGSKDTWIVDALQTGSAETADRADDDADEDALVGADPRGDEPADQRPGQDQTQHQSQRQEQPS